jgi:hypothetical protein
MRIVKKFTVVIFIMFAPMLAQARHRGAAPAAAATGTAFEASAGYTYLMMNTPGQQETGLNGVYGNILVDFKSRWGLTADASYVRTGDVLGTGHSGNVLSVLGGPVFYPAYWKRNRIFIRGLAGVGWVNSAVPVTSTYYLGGTVARLSYAVGGGVEHTVIGPFGVRLGCDYLRTAFANSSGAIVSQNNVRMVGGIVFRFGRQY